MRSKLVVALAALAFMLVAASCADTARLRSAEEKTRVALEEQRELSAAIRSRRLASEARSNIKDHPDLALLLALEANEESDSAEALGVLLDALESHPQIDRYIPGRPGWVADLAFGAGGDLILRNNEQPGSIFFYDPGTGRPDGEPLRFEERITSMTLSQDGGTLAVVAGDKLHLLDFATRKLLRPPTSFEDGSDLVFGPNGVIAARSGWTDIRLWDTLTGNPFGGPVKIQEDMFASDAGGIFLSPIAEASWAGPKSGDIGEVTVTCLARNGTVLLAGTRDGVFRSSDGGVNWKRVASAALDTSIGCLAGSGATIFAGTDVSDYFFSGDEPPGGLFQSGDGGATWGPLAVVMPHANCRALVTSGADLFAGTDRGIYRHSGRSAEWSTLNSGLTDTDVLCLAVRGPFLFAGTDGGGVFRSSDDGASWTAVNAGLKNRKIRALAVMGPALFAGTEGGGVFLSADNGTAWTEVNSGLADLTVNALLVAGQRLFAGTAGGVYTTSTHGVRWTDFNAGLPARTEVNCLAVLGDFLIAGTDGGGGTESNSIGGLAFSPDGKTVVSGSDDGTIRVLTATNLAPCGPRIVAHRGEIKGLCFHPDGKTLASLGEMEIRLWNWPDLTPASEPAVSRSDLSALAYMPDGVLVSIGESEIRRWNGKTLAAIGEPVPICQVRPDQLAVRADGLVATGASDGGVIIWNLRAGNRLLTRLKAHAACGAAFVGPDRLVTAGESGVIRTWSAPDARLLRESRAAGGRELRRLAVSSLGRVAVGLDNGMIQFFDPEMGRLSEPGLALNGMVHGQAFNAAGDRLWACDFIPGSIAIIDVRTNAPAVSSVDAGLGELSDISLSPDEKILAAVGERGLRLFDARDLRPLTAPIKVPEGMMSCVAFTPDGALAVTGGSAMSKECEIRFLDGRTGQPAGPAIWTPPVQKLCLLQGGKIMAGGGFSGEVRLWDVRTRRPVGVLQGRETWVARHLDAGPAGKLAVAFDDGDVEIWDVDPASWMVRARLIANRALTAVERARYLESRAEGVVR